MEITPFRKAYLPQAADLFVKHFCKLRQSIPTLPDLYEDPQRVMENLQYPFNQHPILAAVEQEQLVGYLGWFLVDAFRGTSRKAAYCPVWGHGAIEGRKAEIYRALYRAASEQWAAAGCQVHAITMLAGDAEAEKTWFWNGFGLTVVDAIRPAEAVALPSRAQDSRLVVRRAVLADTAALAELDEEHCQHYTLAPVLMTPREVDDAQSFAAFISKPENSVWMAWDGERPAGFIRFQGGEADGVEIVESEQGFFITGAYVRDEYRGQGAAVRLLNAATADYARQGYTFCGVDFESFNPEAAVFWMKYFEPVCLSVLRVPEIGWLVAYPKKLKKDLLKK